MNTMADGAAQRLVAQIGEALFGQPGLTLMELAEKVKGMRTCGDERPCINCYSDQGACLGPAPQSMRQEPVAWISRIRCVGPEYGKEIYGKLPVQSLNPLYYEHIPLYAATPSPAGQGNALPPIREDQPLRGDEPIGEQHDARMFNRGWNACRDAAAALAAHQPVDPERGHIDPSWSLHDRVEFALRDAGFDLDEAAFVAESVSAQQNAAIDSFSRQPAGREPDFFLVRDEGESRWRESDEATFDCVKRQRPDDAIALHAAPPAQAVDLGQLPRYSKSYSEGIYLDDAGDWVRFADVLALIEGKAVGND